MSRVLESNKLHTDCLTLHGTRGFKRAASSSTLAPSAGSQHEAASHCWGAICCRWTACPEIKRVTQQSAHALHSAYLRVPDSLLQLPCARPAVLYVLLPPLPLLFAGTGLKALLTAATDSC